MAAPLEDTRPAHRQSFTGLSAPLNAAEMARAARVIVVDREGYTSHAVWDVSAWRYGYGTTAPHKGAYISRERAAYQMEQVLAKRAEDIIPHLSNLGLTNQKAGMVLSWAYNIGNHVSRVQEFARRHREQGEDAALRYMMSFHNPGSKYSQGLKIRRAMEGDVFRGANPEQVVASYSTYASAVNTSRYGQRILPAATA